MTGLEATRFGSVFAFVPFAPLETERLCLRAVAVESQGVQNGQCKMVEAIEAHNLYPIIDCARALENSADAMTHPCWRAQFGNVCLKN